MKTFLKIIPLIVIILFGNSFAGTRRPSIPDSKYIEYGTKFDCVLNICGISNEDRMFGASCVAISPDWILTAAHVVYDAKYCGVCISDSEITIIDEIICHKDYDESLGVADIALCHLKKPLLWSNFPQLYNNDDEVGKVCAISGFGFTGNFIDGIDLNFDGKKRAGSNIIDSTMKDMLICSPSKTKGLTELEFLIASGDSGGGLFIEGKLAGINSCVFASNRSPRSVYGDEAGHTRISKFIPWIKEKTKLELK